MAKKNFMQLDCTDEMLEFLDNLQTIHSQAVSIWLRTIIMIRKSGGTYNLRAILLDVIGNHLSRNKALEILKSCGFFTINEAKNTISFSDLAKGQFTRKNGEGKDGNAQEAEISNDNTPVVPEEQSEDSRIAPHEQSEDSRTAPHEQSENSRTAPPEQSENSRTAPPSNAHAYRDRDKEIENKNKDKDRDSRKKLEKRIDVSILLTRAKTEEEKNFYEQMLRSYPRICAMEKPLTYEDFQKLCKKYPQPKVVTVMQAMENRRTLNRQYLSAYLTALTWLKHE